MIRRHAFRSSLRGLLLAAATLVCSAAWAATPGTIRLPDYTTVRLDNGATVLLMPRRDVPLVSANIAVRGGALGDATGKEGSADLLAELLSKGAGNRDALAFAEAVDGAGGNLSIRSGREALFASAQFLARDADLMLELLGDALIRPRLEQAEFDKLRRRAIDAIAAAKDGDPSGLLPTYGDAWLFGAHPYGRPIGGDETSLAAISLEDLHAWRRQQMGGDRLIIAISGDFEPARVTAKVRQVFGSWPAAAGRLPEVADLPRETGRRVLLVDKPGATQSYFLLGNIGTRYGDPAEAAQDLVQTVFGGRFTSMLNTELRVKSGLSYGASANLQRSRANGGAWISSFTRTDATAQALDLAIATLERMHAEPFDADTLASARNYVAGQFAPDLETAPQLASKLVELTLFGQGRDRVDGYLARIAGASAEDVAQARAAFPRGDDLVIVVAGDAAKIRDTLRKYGPVTEMKMTAPRFSP